MARYRIGPEVALCAASVKIHTYAPFDLNMASAVAVKYLIQTKSFAMTYREREKIVCLITSGVISQYLFIDIYKILLKFCAHL